MPKVVDHEDRRMEIARATWMVLQDVGVERLRLRDIAAEVGYTTGVFAHYFPDKDSVLRFAFNLAYQHANDRILRANGSVSSALTQLRNALVALIPDKNYPETVAFVSICFGIRSSEDKLLASEYKTKRNEYRSLLESYLAQAINDGEINVDTPQEDVLDLILAVLDGVCVAALLNPRAYSKSRSARIVDTAIDRLFHNE